MELAREPRILRNILIFMSNWQTQDWWNQGRTSSVQYCTSIALSQPTVGTGQGSVNNHRRVALCIDMSADRPCSFHVATGLSYIQRVSLCYSLHGRTRKSSWRCMGEDQTRPLGTGSQMMGGWRRSTRDLHMQRPLWGSLHMWCSSRLKNILVFL